LTAKELVKALDIPKAVWQTMAHSLQKLIVSDLDMIPVKCSATLLDALLPSVPMGSPGVSTDNTQAPSAHPDVKAAKDDDAVIPIHFWNDRVQAEDDSNKVAILDLLWQHALVWWRKRVRRDFLHWFKEKFAFLFVKHTGYYWVGARQYQTTLRVIKVLHHRVA
jgi:hypothetical protein